MEQTQNRSSIVGNIVLFFLFVPVGIIASFLYIAVANLVGNIYLHVILSLCLGGALFAVVFLVKRLFKITGAIGPCVAVLLGLPFIHYFKWSFYIVFRYTGYNPFLDFPAFMDATIFDLVFYQSIFGYVSELNDVGWTMNLFGSDIDMNGAILWVVWVVELIIISAIPIFAAVTASGVFLHSHNKWATLRYLTFDFEEFSEEECEQIAAGNVDVVLKKPLTTPVQGTNFSTIAACMVDDNQPTDYININTSSMNNKGEISRNIRTQAIYWGVAKINEIETQLTQMHAVVENGEVTEENGNDEVTTE